MARHLGRILSEDYDVSFAADGSEGLDRTVTDRPDLVLTDMMMPGTDGAELVAAVRERPELSEVPILVLTARADEELPARMLRRGAQDYVLKPVHKAELRARVANLLELTGSRKVLQETLESKEDSLEKLARIAAARKQELERALEQKGILLRLLHHRVKGNLQTITSLLQLQLRDVEDAEARRSLQECRGRVATMGLLHELLYRGGAPDRVELSDYLRRLVADVVRSREVGFGVRTALSLEPVSVGVDDAVACGLIVHELVTNALHHAFSANDRGTIRVELRSEDGRTLLRVADDGTGMRDAEPGAVEGLGLGIVRSLATQLDASLGIRTDDGTEVSLVFRTAASDEIVQTVAD
jgi:two-component sensor histidine kinase